jgi:uncharacterized protein YjbI with pentapeptide repeats
MNNNTKASNPRPIKIIPPFLSEALSSNEDLKGCLEREDTIGYIHFSKGVTDAIDRPCLTIRNCIFTQQVFLDCLLKSAQISDVRFENCDLSNIQLAGSSFHRVEFISCKLLGVNLSETTLNYVRMHDCNGQYINLSMSKLAQVQFSQCDFQHGYFNRRGIKLHLSQLSPARKRKSLVFSRLCFILQKSHRIFVLAMPFVS